MTQENSPDHKPRPDDPTFLRARREAFIILGLWTACFFWTISYCYLNGYLSHEPDPKATGPGVGAMVGELKDFNRDPASLSMPFDLGIPDWVFWGILAPWALCILFTLVFCFFIFAEDELAAKEETDESES